MTYNILFAGVGGLGATLTSVILARAAHLDGYKVAGTQVHGLAQRGGSVPVQVRFGKEELYSPTIRDGEADLIFGFELIEALRYKNLASKEKTVFMIDPFEVRPPVLNEEYPSLEKVKEEIDSLAKRSIFVDASKICKEKLGNVIYGKIMMLGIALKEKILPLNKEAVVEAIKTTVPRDLDKNLEALELGLSYEF